MPPPVCGYSVAGAVAGAVGAELFAAYRARIAARRALLSSSNRAVASVLVSPFSGDSEEAASSSSSRTATATDDATARVVITPSSTSSRLGKPAEAALRFLVGGRWAGGGAGKRGHCRTHTCVC